MLNTWTQTPITPKSIILLVLVSNIVFPLADHGLCYDGIQELLKYYPGAKIAYNPEPDQGHVWIITNDNQPIDSYWGNVKGDYWNNPTYLLSSMEELDTKIIELTGYKECYTNF